MLGVGGVADDEECIQGGEDGVELLHREGVVVVA